MSFKNGINGYRSFKVSMKNVEVIGKRLHVSKNLAKKIVANNYRYIRYQGDFFTVMTTRILPNFPLSVWIGDKVNILKLDLNKLNDISKYYEENDSIINGMPKFENNNFNKYTNNLLSELSEQLFHSFYGKSELTMSKFINNVVITHWTSIK